MERDSHRSTGEPRPGWSGITVAYYGPQTPIPGGGNQHAGPALIVIQRGTDRSVGDREGNHKSDIGLVPNVMARVRLIRPDANEERRARW